MMVRKLLPLLALLIGAPAFAQPPTLSLVLDTTTGADKRSVIPKLTWDTTPAATSCTASGSSAWTGAKPASGSVTLAAVSATVTYTLVCSWNGVTKAAITWAAPTTNKSGSPLTNLAGFRVMYGRTATEAGLDTSVYLQSPTATSWTSPDLAAGDWFFGVKAYNALGLESDLSNIASKSLTAATSDTRALQLSIEIPNAPTGVQ